MSGIMSKNTNSPSPEAVKELRDRLAMTQVECAEVIGVLARAWQRYEAGDRSMAPSAWELFKLKTIEKIINV